MVEKLTSAQRSENIERLDGWSYDQQNDAIGKKFKFGSFAQAFGFMTQVALAAEKAGHHPHWSNSYDSVSISLSTHEAGGLSQRDIDLARTIDTIAG